MIIVGGVLLALVQSGFAADPDGGISQRPLSPPSTKRGTTMFSTLSPEQTGLVTENKYADPRMWTDHYQELVYGAIGTGVTIGDYDGDGRPDVFVVSKTERSRLFRNLGNWTFKDVTDDAGLGSDPSSWMETVKSWIGSRSKSSDSPEVWKQGASFADINNDGYLDLYVCRFGAPNLLYVNQGNGTFSEEAAARGLAVVDASGMAAFCDYDRDGWLDLYLQTNLLNATTHPNGQRDYLFHNNGDGTFTDVSERAGIAGLSAGHSATWWDFDGDNWPDIYVANDFATPDRLYRNGRDGTFTDVIHSVVPHLPYYAMGSDLGDVDNDGLLDFFVGDMAPSTHEKDHRGMAGSRARAQLYPTDETIAPQYMRNALYLNSGAGRMREAAYLAGIEATDWTWSVRFEDLDNDGRIDLHVTNGMAREYHNADMLDRIMALERPGDSRAFMKASPVLAESNLAYRNLGDLRFEEVGAEWGLNQLGVSFGAAFGDLDGDGDLDIVYGNYESGATLLRNDSDSGHRLVVELRGAQSNRFGVGATVRIETASGVQGRQLSLARGYLSTSEPILHFGLGHDSKVTRLSVTWPSGEIQAFENLPVDHRLTIHEPPRQSGTGASNENSASHPVVSDFSPALFSEVPAPTGYPMTDEIRVEADFNRDGELDAFVGGKVIEGKYPLAHDSALWARREGALVDVTLEAGPDLRTLGLVTCALWSDVDGDGWPDLLVGVEWGGVRYFHNDQGRRLEDWSSKAGFAAAGTGWWSCLAAADFNADGRMDYVAGNLGLNTRYQASKERPALLFYGNFGASKPQAIEGFYEGDRLLPWLTRTELGTKVASVMKRFPRNDAYGAATLGELVGENRLAAAQRFEATEFRSGVFISRDDGTFEFEPLPRIAQIAPGRAAVAGDFNGDGHADIYVVQNSHAPVASVGRFDGGLSQLLLGNGAGQFEAIAPSKSQLIAPGESRMVRVLDFNGDHWPDFVVSRTGGTSAAFQSAASSDRKFLHVKLKGSLGNPTALGARVMAKHANGTAQVMEVSESVEGVFFGFAGGNPIRHVRVRWPNGRSTTQDVSEDSSSIVLSSQDR